MAQTISSTTRRLRGAGQAHGGGGRRSAHFLNQAHALLAEAIDARAHGQLTEAVAAAYRAGLRTAGAVVAASPVAHRRRLPSSAWRKLELVGPSWAGWAAQLSSYSRMSQRLATGLDREVAPEVVDRLIDQVSRFLDAAEYGENAGLPSAA